jgi:phage terminase large subunit
MMRIEAARRAFRRCWFNESITEAGRDALGYYHERKDENRNVGLGPEHDWSSNCADAPTLARVSRERDGRPADAIQAPLSRHRVGLGASGPS